MKLYLLIGAVALSVALGGSARAVVTVVGDTSAARCSEAALSGRADEESVRFCNEAIDQGSLTRRNLLATYINRGDILMNRRDYAAARADFERAIEVDPAVGDAWVDRGAIAIIEHRFADGIADTTKGLELGGVEDPAKAYFNRAVAYEAIDDEKAAYFDYQQALALKPDWEAPKHELLRFTVTRRGPPAEGGPTSTAAPG
jgi:tetratricopeptide (TPR) repeat protein